MLTKHKVFRAKRRIEWKRIKEKIPPGKHYLKIKKYEERKRRNRNKGGINGFVPSFITLNEEIDFEENIDNLISLTKNINDYLKMPFENKFSIDHKQIKSISIGGLVYLVGQISKVSLAKDITLKYNEELSLKKKDERTRYLFSKIGYWECFGITNPYTVNQEIKDNYFLSIQSNSISDITLLNKIKKFINKNVDFIKDYSVEYKFDDAVKEAMANSIEHAYCDDFSELGKIRGKWWICGHFDKITNSLELVFYDYGMGIRKSIKKNLGNEADIFFVDKLKDYVKSDADLIEIAIKSKLTKYNNYKEHDRGKGFKRFQEFAKVSRNNCEMTIVSDKGRYKYFYDGTADKSKVEKTKLNGNIEGMLIKWKIQLNKGEK